jgi:hypothetical protein
MANNISIFVEGGYLQINCQIPVTSTSDDITAFIEELKFHMLGGALNANVRAIAYAPRELNEKDAARYIGRSLSYLRSFRLNGKGRRQDNGPKYTRDTSRCVRYPIKELDKWLENRRTFSSSCEEVSMDSRRGLE